MLLKKCIQRKFKHVDENSVAALLNINYFIMCKGYVPTIDKKFMNASDIDISISSLISRSWYNEKHYSIMQCRDGAKKVNSTCWMNLLKVWVIWDHENATVH